MSGKGLAGPVPGAPGACVLVTGGAGYIGSHTCVELIQGGWRVLVVDDLSNSSAEALERVRQITGCGADDLVFYEGSILDEALLDRVFAQHAIDAIIHFAGFKAVGESTEKPLAYYENNIAGTLALCKVAGAHGVKRLAFSSSATVYGDPKAVPISESCPKGIPTNPYGHTKSMIEQILFDLYASDPGWCVALLRYFNPIGAHESGLIGEDPKGIPNNLVPYVAQVAVGKRERVGVFGDDYPTPDGTGVRDYIHVVDLARGHVKALEWMARQATGGRLGDGGGRDGGSGRDGGVDVQDGTGPQGDMAAKQQGGVGVFNLGTGKGSSVLEVIRAYGQACGKPLPYEVLPRRAGDIAVSYASCEKARDELGWTAAFDLLRMCEDSWRWQSRNPDGYRSEAAVR
ncbi:MAG: UDP-glucose 4-epimerase GalE [Coriobacteriaceae bacterium]|jgi:UDP-glucose 4-epimerase|nr:UDP-glucose 4-epimerase GalE [Coriobacteriaceae bacterium]